MKIFYSVVFLFLVGCFSGYLLELVFRRVVHKKWINPGFLTGPYLPLYGFGLVLLFTLSSIDFSFINILVLKYVVVIVILTLSMTLIEFITGLIFIKILKVKLWDYSDRRGNIMGIICPLFTFFWGLVGTGYYFLIHPHIVVLATFFYETEFLLFPIGMFFGIFIVDVFYSFRIVAKIKKWAEERQIVVKYETLKLSIAEKSKALFGKRRFFFQFKSKSDLKSEFTEYLKRYH